ncbi:MAG: exodeoxyribonuclease I [Gammaproteobacteria bacterium]|nr:exodeoxyribonuclease I [Gammaproteobacteria bacterium]
MANSFYWYDLETTGVQSKWDRIVQFAGMRTDEDLNPLGDEYCTYVRVPDDVLPNPDASLVTGITPQLAAAKGISETSALIEINRLFSQPGTCVVGYNSLRFDDEFIRYGLYRNLMDPYAREWQQGNSRWDLLDLVRATGGLRREGIEWPYDENELPVYKLEELTKANRIEHGQAHDAMSDVRATVSMARLIKKRQPKLFEYYFKLRHKKQVRALLEPYGAQMCVHVSGMYPRQRFGVAPIVSLTRHPTNGNSIVVVDLAEDIEPILQGTSEEIADKLFTKGAENRPPLKEIRINRCPFVAPIEVLNEENQRRLDIDLNLAKERARQLRQPEITAKVARAYMQGRPEAAIDADTALYEGFLQQDDRSRCLHLHDELKKGRWQDLDFNDKRLAPLADRMKARSFSSLLDPQEIAAWREFVIAKLHGEGDWMNLASYDARLAQLLVDPNLSAEKYAVLEQLTEHGLDLRSRYQI